ncbi:hypothetical protein MTR_2g023950 [Medicago truncatula]|uniref:RNase H type-1 domain-containing protein n=1 Tax=Medicago truncatula TaxID=3880 RepID=A0A072V536_MEDTR|nr:hypothetical protein MTR_2g023950 [Medicago truncatula]
MGAVTMPFAAWFPFFSFGPMCSPLNDPPNVEQQRVRSSVPQLMATDWHVVVEHALRESNACADVLAKIEAWSKSPFVKISKPPIDLSSLLLDDAWGVGFVRN